MINYSKWHLENQNQQLKLNAFLCKYDNKPSHNFKAILVIQWTFWTYTTIFKFCSVSAALLTFLLFYILFNKIFLNGNICIIVLVISLQLSRNILTYYRTQQKYRIYKWWPGNTFILPNHFYSVLFSLFVTFNFMWEQNGVTVAQLFPTCYRGRMGIK